MWNNFLSNSISPIPVPLLVFEYNLIAHALLSCRKHVVIVPIAFTSDHVETLFELDQEVREEIFEDPNTSIQTLTITPGLNNSAVFADALTDIVKSHLDENVAHASPQYPFPCANCVNPECRNIANPIVPYSDLKRQ